MYFHFSVENQEEDRLGSVCASDVNSKDYFVSTRYGSYFIGTSFPEYMSISLVKSRCTCDPVYVGPSYVYRSRRGAKKVSSQ